MFGFQGRNSFYIAALAAVLSLVSVGCGGGGGSSTNNNLSQAQAQALTQQVSLTLVQALQSTIASGNPVPENARPSLSTVVGDLHPDLSSSCTATATGETCIFPVSFTGPCSGGGTISVTGNIDGSFDDSGGGSVQAQLAVLPANCSVSNLVINGAPSIVVDGQIAFTATAPVFPITLTETGGVSYGPNPSGTCQLNIAYTISSLNSCTVTGTACGQPVKGNC